MTVCCAPYGELAFTPVGAYRAAAELEDDAKRNAGDD